MADQPCNARDPGGPLRCEHDFNHDGDHGSKVGDKWHTWENRLDKPTRALGGRTTTNRKSSLRKQSPKQKDKTKAWAFIKRCFIVCQLRTLGYTQCMRCGRKNPPRMELHHMEHAGRGGEWTVDNAELICAGPESCHEQEHGAPEWSKARASA